MNLAGQRESIMFVADEIDTLAALKNRNGSTLAAMLRSAFTGATPRMAVIRKE